MVFSLIFQIVVKRFTITKNSVVEIQNLVLIHESRPAKSNSVSYFQECKRNGISGNSLNLLTDFLFSTVKVPERTANNLNNDLKEIYKWAFQWKMSFNNDPTKQAKEVIFSRKTTKKTHPKIFLNDIPVTTANSQKHLGLHFKTILTKVNRTIGLLRKFQQVLPRPSLITTYKVFIRPYF